MPHLLPNLGPTGWWNWGWRICFHIPRT